MLVTASREKGVLEEEEQDAPQGLRVRRQGAEDVMVPRPDMVALPLDRRCGSAHGCSQPPLYALPGVRGGLRRHRWRAPRTRPIRRASRARAGAHGRPDASCGRRSWCPRPSPWTSCWPSSAAPRPHGDRGRRVRLSGGAGHARGPPGGDRGRDRRRVRPPRRGIRRIGRSRSDRRLVPHRAVQPPVWHRLYDDDYHSVGGWSSANWDGRPGWATRLRFRRPLRGRSIDGPRITEVDVDLTQAEREPAPAEESS